MRGRVDELIQRNGLKLDQITKVTHLTGAGQAELLIEITVVEMALPIHTDQLTAHHSPQIVRVVRILKKGLITLQIATAFQLLGETLDGHVRQREQTIETDSQPAQDLLVIRLQGLLGRRQHRTQRVVDEIQLPVWITRSIAQGIELAQSADAALKHAIAPLLVNVLGAVTGQGGGDANALLRQEFSQIVLAGFAEDREIAAVNHGGAA